ncbi:class I SAM-dependent methyltransferase [Streptomyces violaceus]|uniref:methyltransferase domain-containing protein n=1 Tax=Streptomyces TaxID=1883 RepID=UPI002E1FFB2B|nr:methyltransferase domain-containing protein [Streptomyces violaceus]
MSENGLFTSTVTLSAQPDRMCVKGGAANGEEGFPLSLDMLLILDIMLHEHDVAAAEAQFTAVRRAPLAADAQAAVDELSYSGNTCSIRAQRGSVIVRDDRKMAPAADLTAQSRSTRQVLRALGMRRNLSHDLETPNFRGLFTELQERGLLVPSVGEIDWGQLRRLTPICPDFGISRGTPIDRHYLNQFIAEIRDLVQGDVVEIGGNDGNKDVYGFTRTSGYRGLDIREAPGVSLVGDAADPGIIPADSLDAIIAFNVLEHTARPWQVVDNMRQWLRKGGRAYCMVPSAQRLHGAPEDYWRPLPAALREMFGAWSEQTVYQYGNPMSVIASLMGVAAEELDTLELSTYHPAYPVASCVVARK